MKERANYCQILGLNPFREDGYDLDTINAAIDARYTEWQAQIRPHISAGTIHVLAENIGAVPNMRSVMANKTLRKSEFERARNCLSEQATRLRTCMVVTVTGETVLIHSLAENLVENLRWNDVTLDDLVSAAMIQEASLPEVAPAQIVNAFEAINDLGFHTPYEFVNHILNLPSLGFGGKAISPEDGPDAFLTTVDTIYNKRDRFAGAHMIDADAYRNAIMKLHSSIRTSNRIAELVRYGRTHMELEPVMEMISVSPWMMSDAGKVGEIVASSVTGKVEDPDLAILMLEHFCYRSGIPADFHGVGDRFVICPGCRAMFEGGDRSVFCPYCGTKVKVTCPRCGRIQPSADRVCTNCGCDIGAAEKDAAAVAEEAEKAIAEGDVAEAKRLAAELATDFPRFKTSESLGWRVETLSSDVESLKNEADAKFRAGFFSTVRRMLSAAAEKYPFILDDPAISEMFEKSGEAVANADSACADPAGPDSYIKAAIICPDHPKALAYLNEHPPETPAAARTGYNTDGIAVYCVPPEDERGITYCFYRGYGAPPEINNETVPTAESDIGYWLDTEARPGEEVFYRIRTRRWGVFSEGSAEAGPAVLAREVTNVVLSQLEDGIGAAYEKPAGCVGVRVWRKKSSTEPGIDETEIPAGDGMFEDRGLDGNERYAYLFVAEYPNGVRSYGNVFKASTVPFPDPVTDMVVRWSEKDGTFTAEWSGPRQVSLFVSAAKPDFPSVGVPLAELSGKMTEIETETAGTCAATFRLPRHTTAFVTPVVKVGTTGIVGSSTLIADPPPISDLVRTEDGGRRYLRFAWPDGCTEVCVTNGESRISVRRETGETEGRVPIPSADVADMAMSLNAVYPIGERNFSSAATMVHLWSDSVKKVSYTVTLLPVQSDRGKREVAVFIKCPGATFLPQMVLVLAPEGIPLRASEGETIWKTDSPMILKDGTYRGSCFMDRNRAEIARMRLFFKDQSEYAKYHVVHPIYRRRRDA